MQIDEGLKRNLLIGVGIFFGIFISLFLLFGITKIEVSETDSFFIDGKTKKSPWNGYLIIGRHNISTSIDGFQNINETVTIRPGSNEFKYKLRTNKEIFIETMPIYDDYYDIDYNKYGDFFFVNIKVQDIVKAKSSFLELLRNNGINPDNEQIKWEYVAGVNGRSGP